MITDLVLVAIVAIVCQATVEQIKKLIKFHKGKWYNDKINLKILISMIVSLIVCISYKIDLLSLLGLNTSLSFVGFVITSIIISAGSTTVHELISKITEAKSEK